MNRVAVCLFTCLMLAAGSTASAAGKPPRSVEIRYDMTKIGAPALEVWLDCQRTDNDLRKCGAADDPRSKKTGPEAYNFELRTSDRVVFIMSWKRDEKAPNARAEITYAVTGTNLDDKDLAALKKFVGAGADTGRSVNVAVQPDTEPDMFDIKPLTDDLIAGGRVNVTFSRMEHTTDPATERILETAGPFAFRIESAHPRITVSGGIALSTAPDPEVAIVKTTNIVTFDKEGTPQQAYEQMIVVRDNDTKARPIQSLITFANFRLAGPVYASVGFQLNQQIFEEPLIGGTYRRTLGKAGLNFTGAVHFSREVEILESSGFFSGQRVDPTLGLTVDDIPTDLKYHRRFAFAMTIDF